MKKLCLMLMMLSPTALASTVDELIESFENSNIYSADWYEKGSSKIAESSNDYRDIKVNLTDKKGAIIITQPFGADFDDLAISPCYRLTAYIDYDKSATWADPSTDGELLISSVFSSKTKMGQENKAELNGWNLSFKRLPSGFTCEVVKSN
ncbi:hypothetical protein BCT62_09720 [Vibrio splendidus]|uniref:hypothetical protein n=1 Tax=Vibrio splendidus TaxID=29497 RepID=UPI000CC32308|nr:hypothetical protein [Vibrio splendidus]PMM11640.1 hypothetical protein BCT62_09720 [Vibrio splendidus]